MHAVWCGVRGGAVGKKKEDREDIPFSQYRVTLVGCAGEELASRA